MSEKHFPHALEGITSTAGPSVQSRLETRYLNSLSASFVEFAPQASELPCHKGRTEIKVLPQSSGYAGSPNSRPSPSIACL